MLFYNINNFSCLRTVNKHKCGIKIELLLKQLFAVKLLTKIPELGFFRLIDHTQKLESNY
ncbi:MAG: hypothetical protein Wins2KO_08050 [Winogradskyella sp.]